MSKIFLDMGKYKKIKSDKDITTLRHSDGHEIRLAHNALTPKIRQQLKDLPDHGAVLTHEEPKESKKVLKLAEGGQVGSSANLKENYGTGRKKTEDDKEQVYPPASESQRMSSKSLPKKMATGGGVELEDYLNQDSQAAQEAEDPMAGIPVGTEIDTSTDPEQSVAVPLPPAFQKRTAGPDIGDAVGSGLSNIATGLQAFGAGFKGETLPVEEPMAAMPPAATREIAATPPQSLQPPLNQPAPPSDPIGLGAQQDMLQQGFNAGQAGIAQEQAAEQQLGRAKAIQAQQQVEQLHAIDNEFKTKASENEQQINNVIEDIRDGHIKPNQYLENMGAGQRVATAIGLIIGGLGGSDAPMQFLQKQIDRDIDAQRHNIAQNNNVLAAYQQKFGNIRDAADMAKLTQVGIYGAELDKAAAAATDPAAKARALQAKSKLYETYAPVMQKFTMNRMITEASRSGKDPSQLISYLRIANPEMAKEMESRMIPSSGPQGQAEMASIPLTPEVRKDIVAKTDLIKATQNLRDWARQHSGSLDPGVRGAGQALALELQQKYRQGVGASTSEEEQKIISKIINADPGQILSRLLVDPKLKALEDSIGHSLNSVRKHYGLPEHSTSAIREQELTPQQRTFVEFARKHPQDPRSAAILKKLGIQ